MERHFRSIAERLENEIVPQPFLEDGLSDSAGSLWALGFIQAAERNQAAWAPLTADKHGARKLLLIASLGIDPNEVSGQAVKPEQRWAVLDQLPELVKGIGASGDPRACPGEPQNNERQKSAATILAPADQARSSRNAAERLAECGRNPQSYNICSTTIGRVSAPPRLRPDAERH